jgi:hypothetical protein
MKIRKFNSKGISHLLVPLLIVVLVGAIGGTYLLLVTHAATPAASTSITSSTATAFPSGGKVHLCLYYAQSECIATHGIGNDATVQTSSLAEFTVISVGSAAYEFQNSTGHCLVAPVGSSSVTVSPGACAGHNNEIWLRNTSSAPYRFQNKSNTKQLVTSGKQTGSSVLTWSNGGPSGFNYTWINR